VKHAKETRNAKIPPLGKVPEMRERLHQHKVARGMPEHEGKET